MKVKIALTLIMVMVLSTFTYAFAVDYYFEDATLTALNDKLDVEEAKDPQNTDFIEDIEEAIEELKKRSKQQKDLN